ncbi:MAG: PAS domain-containing sensor histidine kinase [Calditrichaeota bacterium]|nr:MAG: PAS domain-containing sensor histidine kinase [Calditrichota bacterium]
MNITEYLQNLPTAILHVDAQNKPEFANEALLRLCGVASFSEFKQSCAPILDTIHSNDAAVPFTISQNGTLKLIRYTSRKIKSPNSENEITELVIEELLSASDTMQLLEKQNDSLTKIINLTFDILLKIDMDCKIHWVGWQIEEILGFDAESFIGKNMLDFIHEEDKANFSETLKQISFNMNADIQQIRLRNKMGTWPHFRCRVYQIYLGNNGDIGVQVALHDVHLSVMAERSLRSSEARYRSFIDNFPEPIIQFDFENTIIFVNPAFKKTAGFSSFVAYSENFLHKFIGEDSLSNFKSHLQIAQKGHISQTEIVFNTLEGVEHTAIATALPLMESGRVTSFCAVIRDITNEKLLQNQLIQTHKMETIGTMARGIAHDFNNILTGIIGNASILRETVQDDEFTMQTIAEIEKAAERCTHLTRGLLTFSRQGKTSIEPTDLNGLIQTMIRLLRRIIPSSIIIEAPVTLNLSPVLVDQSKIQQVITNLVVNSRDAIQKKGDSQESQGKISIHLEEIEITEEECKNNLDAHTGKHLKVSVSDTGTGISEAALSQIYDPFFSTKEVAQESGLGLSTVFGIIQEHKGWIEVTTEPDIGSVFQFYLPTLDESIKESKYIEEKIFCPGGTILIVDDDELVRNVASKSLERYGYHVLIAQNGEEAFALFKANESSIDVLLIDLTMPELDGRALIEKIHRTNPEIKAILSSGYDHELEISDPHTFFLPKPYVIADLVRLVGKAIQP